MIFALFGLVGLGYNAFNTNLTSLKRLNQENLIWTSDQLKYELSAVTRELALLHSGLTEATPASVNAKFDVFWSRVAQSETGSVGQRLRAYDTEDQVLKRVLQLLRTVESDMVNLKADDLATIESLLTQFRRFERPIFSFDRRVFLGEEELVADVRAQIFQSALFTAAVTLVAFTLSCSALFWVNRESARNRDMADRNLRLAEEAERANHAKSRFLTMMSHELRTPMNGVLGMISLAKQPGMAMPQLRLIEQAERSGKQMISMLSDILDYATLQDNEMELEAKPFAISGLRDTIHELFGSVARREGIEFEVNVEPQCPQQVIGDAKRLRQIVAHFASYIVEMAGTDNVDIRIGHEGKALRVTIEFDYGQDPSSEVWRPEILLGTTHENDTQFASDALGPAVARGILAQMGGSVHLGHTEGNRISVILTAPIEPTDFSEVVVHIETKSAALRTICEVGLNGTKAKLAAPDFTGTAQIVMIECGGGDELELVKALKKQHPSALFMALGTPITPSDFDAVLDVPIDLKELQSSVLRQVVG